MSRVTKPKPHPRAIDVLVVHSGEQDAAVAYRLRDALLRLGLDVKLDVFSTPSTPGLPADVLQHARRAHYCVLLHRSGLEDGGPLRFAAMPAPTAPGQQAKFAKPGAPVVDDSVEIGQFAGDVEPLAERVAARVRSLSGRVE